MLLGSARNTRCVATRAVDLGLLERGLLLATGSTSSSRTGSRMVRVAVIIVKTAFVLIGFEAVFSILALSATFALARGELRGRLWLPLLGNFDDASGSARRIAVLAGSRSFVIHSVSCACYGRLGGMSKNVPVVWICLCDRESRDGCLLRPARLLASWSRLSCQGTVAATGTASQLGSAWSQWWGVAVMWGLDILV